MNHFIVSFEGVELTDQQATRVQSALEGAAKKEYQSFSPTPDALPIAREPGTTAPTHNPGGGRGNPGGDTTGGGREGSNGGTGKPVGKHGFPIVWPVSYNPATKSWTRL